MKYSCNLVKDLLPLYIDNVCSEESREIVEQHLAECSDCKAYYISMGENNPMDASPVNQDQEYQKAQSFLVVKRKLRLKQLLAALVSAVVLVGAFISAVAILSSHEKVVEYDDNISVSMVDGSLVERLNGSSHKRVNVKRVETQSAGRPCVYLFFCIYDTQWDDLITGKDAFTECVLCPMDRGADGVDAVYYFTGDDTGIENMGEDELHEVIDQSILLWSK